MFVALVERGRKFFIFACIKVKIAVKYQAVERIENIAISPRHHSSNEVAKSFYGAIEPSKGDQVPLF